VFSDGSDSSAPLCSPEEGTTLLTALSEVSCSQDLLPPAQERGGMAAWQQLERVLQLLVVLWGDLPDMTSPGEDSATPSVACGGVSMTNEIHTTGLAFLDTLEGAQTT